ncbi:hypothetical protein HDV62DRAFT_30694 [Trichoderma sp. SZMC 28011]
MSRDKRNMYRILAPTLRRYERSMRRTMVGSTVYAYPQRSRADETNPPLNQEGKGYYRVSLFWNVRVCTKYRSGVKLFFFFSQAVSTARKTRSCFMIQPHNAKTQEPTSTPKPTVSITIQLREDGTKYIALLNQKKNSITKRKSEMRKRKTTGSRNC